VQAKRWRVLEAPEEAGVEFEVGGKKALRAGASFRPSTWSK